MKNNGSLSLAVKDIHHGNSQRTKIIDSSRGAFS
jgi:hypothetical protein